MDRLFVYGTLRVGSNNENAARLARQSRHIGRGSVRGRLYRVAHYPGLALPLSDTELVTGDVFDGVTADLLRELDEYEGDGYRRDLAEVSMEAGGGSLAAYLYRYVLPTDGLEWIPSGDWNTISSPSSAPE